MFLFVGREQSWRGVIGAVRSVWTAIFPPNRNFRFYQIWHRHRTVREEHRHRTNWFQSVRFGRLSVASNFLETKQIKEKEKANFPLVSHIFSSSKHQAPSKQKKKKLKIMYIFRVHTKIRKYIYIYIYISLCFPMFSHHPNTKHQAK